MYVYIYIYIHNFTYMFALPRVGRRVHARERKVNLSELLGVSRRLSLALVI